ncbi:hypothetical protein GLOTRDRAFT_51375, partial [Gloeophyllum trabeum ATCC 11539]
MRSTPVQTTLVSACNQSDSYLVQLSDDDDEHLNVLSPSYAFEDLEISTQSADSDVLTMYKRVDRKIKPVPGIFPEDARVIRKFPENPLDSLPMLPVTPPDFKPTVKFTAERLGKIGVNSDGFLWPEE